MNKFITRALVLKFYIFLFALWLVSPGVIASSMSGFLTTAPSLVNLSTEGSGDWIHWGLTSKTDVDRKAGVSTQISHITAIGGALAPQFKRAKSAYTWSQGSPTSKVTSTTTGLRIYGIGKGFKFTAPANTTERTLKVYLGANSATGRLVARLSDGSAPNYVVTIKQGSSTISKVLTLNYQAASAGQLLTVSYVVDSKPDPTKGWVSLESAALTTSSVAINNPPVLNAIGNQTVTEGQTFSVKVSANDADEPLAISLRESNNLPGSPSILTDNGNGSGQLSWTAVYGDAAPNPYRVTITATDGAGASSSKTIEVTVLAAASDDASASASLTGALSTAPFLVNLSTEGNSDWIHWGLTSKTDVDRKAGVSAQISQITSIGGALAPQFKRTKSAYTWSQGSPTAKVTSTTTGLRIYGIGKGFKFTAPANTTERTLKVYLGANSATGRLVARLSDGSAPNYVVTIKQGSSTISKVLTLSYRAASAGQLLTVSYVVDSKPDPTKGWISLESAAITASNDTLQPFTPAIEVQVTQFQSEKFSLLPAGVSDSVQIQILYFPKFGDLTLGAYGMATYVPKGDYFGNDEFIYQTTDLSGNVSIAAVSLQIECVSNCSHLFKVSWDQSTSEGVIAYKVYVGRDPNVFNEVISTNYMAQIDYLATEKGDYYFAVSAINDKNVESELSKVSIGSF